MLILSSNTNRYLWSWIKRKLEHANKISERTDINPLVGSSVIISVSNVSKKIVPLLLSSRLRIADVKMVTSLQIYTKKEKCIPSFDSCLPQVRTPLTYSVKYLQCTVMSAWAQLNYMVQNRHNMLTWHWLCPASTQRTQWLRSQNKCFSGTDSHMAQNALQSQESILKNRSVIFS